MSRAREGLPERYVRALDKLTEGRSAPLDERSALQAERLRERFGVSEVAHAALLAELLGVSEVSDGLTPPPPLECALKLSLEGESTLARLECALLHRGDFTFEQLELSVYGARSGGAQRLLIEALDPDEHEVVSAHLPVSLIEGLEEGASERWVGVQLQLKLTDITGEVTYARSVALAAPLHSRPQGESAQSEGAQSEVAQAARERAEARFKGWGLGVEGPLFAADERSPWSRCVNKRSYFSLLGPGDWREVPLLGLTEGEFYAWEVAAAQPLTRAEGDEGTRRLGERLEVELKSTRYAERLCAGGRAWMGAPLGVGRDWETPLHLVEHTTPLWCAETPVTQALWREVMGESPSALDRPEAPVDSVSWWEAVTFCNRLSERVGLTPVYAITEDEEGVTQLERLDLAQEGSQEEAQETLPSWGYRLPTEAEWEHLARAGQDRPFAGSHEVSEVAWSLESRVDGGQEVAQKKPNAWGLYDLSGNVWAWCEDGFDEHVYRYRPSGALNPRVPPQGDRPRVRRGGSWASSQEVCRVFSRAQGDPSWRSHFVGFRVVRSERGGALPADQAITGPPSWALLSRGPVALVGAKGTDKRGWSLRLEALGVRVTRSLDEALSVVWVWCPRHTLKNPKLKGLDRHPRVKMRTVEEAQAARPRRPSRAVHLALERAQGLGRLTLEEHELLALLLTQEASLSSALHAGEVYALEELSHNQDEPQDEPQEVPQEEPTPQESSVHPPVHPPVQPKTPPKSPPKLRVGLIGRFSMTQAALKEELRGAGLQPVPLTSHTRLDRLSFVVCGGGREANRQRARCEREGVRLKSEAECLMLLRLQNKSSDA